MSDGRSGSMSAAITEQEWMEELDKLRIGGRPRIGAMTDEQFRAIDYARNSLEPVSWDKLVIFWRTMGWGKRSRSWIVHSYNEEKGRRDAGE